MTRNAAGTLANFDKTVEIVSGFVSAHYDRGMLLNAWKEYGKAAVAVHRAQV